MKRNGVFGWAATVALAGVVLVSGCTAIRRDDTLQTERTLAAAGFQMKFAHEPEKLANTEAIVPQRSLVPQEMDGETRFVYADAEFCKCIWVGTEAAMQRYQKLSIAQQITQARLQTAEANEAATMNWGAWGGWGPWY